MKRVLQRAEQMRYERAILGFEMQILKGVLGCERTLLVNAQQNEPY